MSPSLLAAFVIGLLLGGGLGLVVGRRRVPEPDPVPSPEPAADPDPALSPEAAGDGAAGRHLEVATAVLDVAEQIASPALARRLGEAVRPLAGVTVITAVTGAAFDPARHHWESTRARGGPQEEEGSISSTAVPGLAGPDGVVIRKARVVVFE